MNKINRHELVRALAKFQTKESPDNSRLTLRDVSRWLDVLDLRRRDAVREMNRHFARDLDAARLAVAVIGAFAFHLGVGEGAQDFKRPWKPGLPPTGPLPMDWIDSRGRPDPNFFLVSLVTQVANQGLAVLTLIEQGLESPARSMLRTFIELVSTTLIVVGDQERMRVYTKAAHPVAARKAWQKYFTKGEALKTLRDIQVSIGLSRRMADGVAKERFGDYEYYSASVHHAALPALVWAYTPSFYTKKRLAYALFGRAGGATCLPKLIETLVYFIGTLYEILEKKHGVDFSKSQWRDIHVLWLSTLSVCVKGHNAKREHRHKNK